jgi:hypothetical protein
MLAGSRAPETPVTANCADRGVEHGFEGEFRRVGLEVLDDLNARGVAAVSLRHRQARQAGAGAVRVKMQAVVMASPRRADRVALLENDGLKSARTQCRRRREAGGTGADNDRVA